MVETNVATAIFRSIVQQGHMGNFRALAWAFDKIQAAAAQKAYAEEEDIDTCQYFFDQLDETDKDL